MSTVTPIIERGRTLGFRLTLTLDGVAEDVSAWTFAGAVSREPGGAALLTLTVDDTDAATGVILFTATDTETATIPDSVKYAAVNLSGENTAGNYTLYRRERVAVVDP